jgi:hypothetical protein
MVRWWVLVHCLRGYLLGRIGTTRYPGTKKLPSKYVFVIEELIGCVPEIMKICLGGRTF